MDARQVAEAMFQCWMLGLVMLYLVKTSKYSDLLRVDKKGLLRFAKFLLLITLARYAYLNFIASDHVIESVKRISDYVPWQTTPGVFWEDMCNAVPLVLAERMFKNKKWFKILKLPLLATMSLAFGLGHAYEGLGAILTMTCYIPITMRLGKKYGFGTVMISHISYDLITLLTFKLIAGA